MKINKIREMSSPDLEKELGESVITNKNALNYKYLDDNKLNKEKQLNDKSKKKLKENDNT